MNWGFLQKIGDYGSTGGLYCSRGLYCKEYGILKVKFWNFEVKFV